MKKALIILFLLTASTSWAAEIDPYSMQFWFTSPDYEARVYRQYGNSDYNFFYQVNDVTGASRTDRVAGPQWFATVYENYYYAIRGRTDQTNWGIYRRTMGGGMPAITFRTVGDLIAGFNFIFAEEPEPYAYAWRRYVNSQIYDIYPDPLESLCLLITNGQGKFKIEFGNPYARHFPFWWYLTSTTSSSSTKWWQQAFDWRNETYPTLDPIAYIYSSSEIYVRNDSIGRYEKGYTLETSGDKTLIKDMSSTWLYTISGDAVYTSADNVLTWSFNESRDRVYDSSGKLLYTVETDTAGDKFICGVRTIYESVVFSGFNDGYNITLSPSGEQAVQSGSSYTADVNVRGTDASDYGSKVGTIAFRQGIDFATGYTGYREFANIPVVIANVAQGNASVTPLLFDMIVRDGNDDVVSRTKFTWDAQYDNLNQNLGTFFMIGSRDVTYKLETRITNRTGTRYELYRYDMIGSNGSNPTYRDNYSSIMPDHWKYDLTPDMYGTLPDSFLLDAHSQIAPGLVTVYRNNIGEGYRTIDLETDMSESFRLTEYSNTSPKNLRLNYKRIEGMTPLENGTYVPFDGVKVQEFSMQFADVAANSDQTTAELTTLMGKTPSMITREIASDAAAVREAFVNSSAIDPFSYVRAVPEGLVRLRSEDTSPTTSADAPRGVMLPSDIIYTSIDIPVVPMSIRMKVRRDSQLISNHWDELYNAANSQEVFNIFARYGTVWLRSDSTAERDADLFRAIGNKGSSQGVGAVDCVRAFIYDDELYLDFIVLLADGKSTKGGNNTAYVEVFKDDNVPYILIGDGKENGIWEMMFYIAPVSANSNSGSNTNDEGNTSNSNGVPSNSSSGGGGGGCNAGIMIVGLLLLLKRK